MKKNTSNRGPGRPKADINVPNKKFTFDDLCVANGVDPKTGKGDLTKLTLRKFLARDTKRNNRSEVVLLKNEKREPDSQSGLGRKTFVYIKRTRLAALKAARKVSVNIGTGKTVKATVPVADYEATKAALLAPTPDPVDTTPVIPTAPVPVTA